MLSHEDYMQRAIDLAQLGAGNVAPNPMVGAVIVHEGKIIGEGYHQKYGEPHAEVNAVNSVKDKSLLPHSTIYVTLEPCAHYGKTPPCALLIVKHNFKEVIIGCRDSYEEVDGKGVQLIEEAGIKVKIGVLKKDCLELNKRFFTFHQKNRPYVILKWAQDQNGYIDRDRTKDKLGNHWITQPETKSLTHKWRAEEAAILVGNRTVANDNPSLTAREFSGPNPARVIIDQKMKLDYGAFNVGDRSVPTYILTEKVIQGSGNLKFINPKTFKIADILTKIHELNLNSIIIEGGATTINKFIEEDLWDEARILVGVHEYGKGQKAPIINKEISDEFNFGLDTIKIIYNA